MTSLCSLSDDLLAEIFLHLPTLADIGRAAAACPAFRRVAADHAFLRRLRRAHPAAPLLLGFLSPTSLFLPAEPPHSSAPAARSLAQATDFSFAFVPSAAGRHFTIDTRDGRVLINHEKQYTELAVCDPLRRQYLVLPEIPQADVSSAASPDRPQWKKRYYRRAFLVPSGEAKAETPSPSFKVLYMEERSPEPPSAFVFSSATGQWSRLAMNGVHGTVPPLYRMRRHTPCYANGCFYWIFTTTDVRFNFFSDDDDEAESNVDRLLVLDTRSMEFSTVDLPPPGPGYAFRDHVVVEAAEEGGGIGMFTLHKSIHDSRDAYIEYTMRGLNGEWRPKKIVLTLPPLHNYKLLGATDRCLLLHGYPTVKLMRSPSWDRSNVWGTSDVDFALFSVEFGSMQINKVCRSLIGEGVPYTGFPPSLCLPSV